MVIPIPSLCFYVGWMIDFGPCVDGRDVIYLRMKLDDNTFSTSSFDPCFLLDAEWNGCCSDAVECKFFQMSKIVWSRIGVGVDAD
jgi:hypothetical protein